MKTIICFSGGYDSLYLLWKALTDTTDDVVAFRVNYVSEKDFEHNQSVSVGTHHGRRYWNFNRIKAERIAADNGVAWLKENTRDFEYVVELGNPKAGFRNVGEEAVSLAAKYARRVHADRIWYGQEAHQVTVDGGQKHAKDRKEIAKKITSAPLEHPLVDWNEGKAHAFANMPEELTALGWCCFNPKVVEDGFEVCGDTRKEGTCHHGCFRVAESRELLSKGVTPDKILDHLKRRLRVGPYANLPPVD